MKKLSILVGALGGALGGYLLSNSKLREGMINAKDPEAAAKMLGKHLQHDGRRLAQEVQKFAKSKEVREQVSKAKKFARMKVEEAKRQVDMFMQQGGKQATKAVKSGTKSVKSAMKRTVTKAVSGFKSEEIS